MFSPAKVILGSETDNLSCSVPEYHIPSIDCDARTDIYLTGATLYFMLTGSLPPGAVERMLRKKEIEEIPYVTTAVNRIISKCMNLDPDRRYQSTTELCEDLTEWGDR